MNIAFWNVQKKNISSILVDLVINDQVEILCLAEASDVLIIDFLKIINIRLPGRKFYDIPIKKGKVKVLSSLAPSVFNDCTHSFYSKRWSALLISIPKRFTINLICVHFHSKVNWSEISLALECVNLSRDVLDIEKSNSCTETILIGDFNMNPFENGIVAANGLNAIPDLNYAVSNPIRRIDGTEYRYFYNPMWNYFGDNNLPYGTHYFRPSGHVSHEWHIYDQILIRPTLKQHFKKSDIKIITKIGTEDLTKTYNRPDKIKYSDHLPISINLTI